MFVLESKKKEKIKSFRLHDVILLFNIIGRLYPKEQELSKSLSATRYTLTRCILRHALTSSDCYCSLKKED